MPDFEHDNSHDLELSAEYMYQLMLELAKALILRGKPEVNPGTYPPDGGETPYAFTYPLDRKFAKETFFPGDGDIVISEADVLYAAPHKLEPPDVNGDPRDFIDKSGIAIQLKGHLHNPQLSPEDQIEVYAYIDIDQEPDQVSARGYFDIEFSQGDMRISPNDIPAQEIDSMDRSEMRRFFEDQHAMRRALNIDDRDKIQQVIDYIDAHPRID